MAPIPAAGDGQKIDADNIARIELIQDYATQIVQMRIVMTDLDKSHLLDFPDMDAAIRHYRLLWSRRTADLADSDSSKSQTA